MNSSSKLTRYLLAGSISCILAGSAAAQDVTINLFAGKLYGADGITAVPQGGLLLFVASTQDSTFASPTATSFTPGADDIVVAAFGLNNFNGPNTGTDSQSVNLTYSGNFGNGDLLQFYWYPTLTTASYTNGNGPGGQTPYGQYRTDSLLGGSDIAWVAPAGGGNTFNLNFATTSIGGDVSDIFGRASFVTPVPEPSTYALFGLGLGGLGYGLVQRRRQQAALAV